MNEYLRILTVRRSTPLVLAVQRGHAGAARALVEAGAAIRGVVPRRGDGSERAPSLARLAADMRRGDLVSLLARGLVERDSSERWAMEWAAAAAAAQARAPCPPPPAGLSGPE